MNNRRFNEAEVAEIFERAAELQHTGIRKEQMEGVIARAPSGESRQIPDLTDEA